MSLALTIAAAAALAAPDCPIDRAVYRLNTDAKYTAGFVRQDRRKVHASDLVFWLKTPLRTYYFSLSTPNGYGGTYIVPDMDPRLAEKLDDDAERDAAKKFHAGEPPNIPLDAFGPDLKPYGMPPTSDSKAPALIFARGLGPELWYGPSALAGGDPAAVQESMPVGMFEAAGCAGPPPPR